MIDLGGEVGKGLLLHDFSRSSGVPFSISFWNRKFSVAVAAGSFINYVTHTVLQISTRYHVGKKGKSNRKERKSDKIVLDSGKFILNSVKLTKFQLALRIQKSQFISYNDVY